MFLTQEALKKYRAQTKNIEKFNELYPNGEEFINVIKDARAPSDLLHWGYEYLPITKEEQEAYTKRLSIINCSGYFYSKNIEDCNFIFESRNCKNSELVKNSIQVENSELVIDSRKVVNCKRVFESKDIKDSNDIIQSDTIYQSNNIGISEKVYNSSSIFRSNNIFDSAMLRKCANVKNVIFSADCEKSSNLIFCSGLRGEDCFLFNRPVAPETFNQIKEEIFTQFPDISLNLFTFNKASLAHKLGYRIFEYYDIHYKSIPNEFFDYIKTLPGYDPIIMYFITLNPNFLDEKENLKNSEI